MKRKELIELAQNLNISEKYYTSPDKELIRVVQQAEGNPPCYLSDKRYNCNEGCKLEDSCQTLTATWLR